MKNRSKKRDALLNELQARNDHPTAEELYEAMSSKISGYSLSTVYRNLNELAASGLILKIQTEDACRFDGQIEDHEHFYCMVCGRLIDIDEPARKLARKPASNIHLAHIVQRADSILAAQGCKLVKCNIVYTGICDKCNYNTNNESEGIL